VEGILIRKKKDEIRIANLLLKRRTRVLKAMMIIREI
jgi:hypothetical protein